MITHDPLTCPACMVGRLQQRRITYVHVYNGTLVSVPNMPAWQCDFCRAIEYDTDSLQRIDALVGHSGPPPNRHPRQKGPGIVAKPRAFPPEI